MGGLGLTRLGHRSWPEGAGERYLLVAASGAPAAGVSGRRPGGRRGQRRPPRGGGVPPWQPRVYPAALATLLGARQAGGRAEGRAWGGAGRATAGGSGAGKPSRAPAAGRAEGPLLAM